MTQLTHILFPPYKSAILAFADGSLFHGYSIGYDGAAGIGEVVFNTAMTGYQEILSDPSYAGQIVTLTYPHIGNTGINPDDMESLSTHAAGLIIRDYSPIGSNWRKTATLGQFLKDNQITAIAGVDTRELTRKLRKQGSLNGCIMVGESNKQLEEEAIQYAKNCVSIQGVDLAVGVTTQKQYQWSTPIWQLTKEKDQTIDLKYKVVCYDFGVKHNILRILYQMGCSVTVVPADTSAEEVLSHQPDGVFLSNGPGDPEACHYAIKSCQKLLDENIPIFGICLGHQILAIASHAQSEKMKFGHHGANHPVSGIDHVVMVTSQNHNFAISEQNMPDNLEVTYRSLFDGSVQGIRRLDKPAYGFQGHPEASPGPHDARHIFMPFIESMSQAQQEKGHA